MWIPLVKRVCGWWMVWLLPRGLCSKAVSERAKGNGSELLIRDRYHLRTDRPSSTVAVVAMLFSASGL